MFERRSLFALVFGGLAVCGFYGCATDEQLAPGDNTSVAVLSGSDGVLGGNTSDGNTGSGGGPAASSLPAYPTRDANLWLQSNVAWQTYLATHWGNTDWVGTSYDYAHILDALAVHIEVNSSRRYVGLAEALYARIATGAYAYSSNTDTLDTPAFMALGLAHLYNATANAQVSLPNRAQYLAQAQSILAPVVAAEATDSNNVSLGLYIDSAHSSRRTSVNGGAILAALQIYQANNDAARLAFARRIYAAWYQAAVNPSTFTVADGITSGGSVDAPMYTYNYGLMIGAAVALHAVTGEAHYLVEARAMASTLLQSTMITPGTVGPVLVEPQCLTNSCGLALVYRGLTLRALAQLAAIDGSNSDVQGLLNGTAAALAKNRNASDGHWPSNWAQAGASTQDPAADVAVAMALGYLSLSAPSQSPASPGGLTALAVESGLGVNLPILPGSDGTVGWATVGPFTSTTQALTASLVSPLAGAASLKVRYAVPDSSTPSLLLALTPDGSTPTVPLSGTGSAQTVGLSAAVTLTLTKGLNTAVVTAPAMPANVQIDSITVVPQQTLNGATCVPHGGLTLLAPVAGDRLCGLPTFTWKGGSGTQAQTNVLIDGNIACTAQGTAQSCVLTQALSSGRHTWQVMEDGCSLSAVQAFDVAQKLPSALTAQVAVQGNFTVLSWAAPTDGQAVDVTVNGTVVCGQLKGPSCALTTSGLLAAGKNSATVSVTNSCGRTTSSQLF